MVQVSPLKSDPSVLVTKFNCTTRSHCYVCTENRKSEQFHLILPTSPYLYRAKDKYMRAYMVCNNECLKQTSMQVF